MTEDKLHTCGDFCSICEEPFEEEEVQVREENPPPYKPLYLHARCYRILTEERQKLIQ